MRFTFLEGRFVEFDSIENSTTVSTSGTCYVVAFDSFAQEIWKSFASFVAVSARSSRESNF